MPCVLMIIESLPFARDHRARKQVFALLGHRYRVVVICQRDPGNAPYRGVDGLRLYEYRSPPEMSGKMSFAVEYGYSTVAAALLTMLARSRVGFDVIQVCAPPDTQFILALPFKLVGTSLVVDQRDLSPEVYIDRYKKRAGLLLWLLRATERLSWRSSDHVLCVNDSLRRTIIDRGGLSEDLVTVVGNGPVASRVFERPKREPLREGKAHLGCWIGLMGPQDHVDLAVRAIHHLVRVRNRKDCHFAFIGEGESLPMVRQLVETLGISDFVTFTGWLNEDACFDYLSTADVALDSNLQEEVSPVKGMEYMAFGVPFVAFDLHETRRMAEDAAIYAKPGDSAALAEGIDDLLTDRRRRDAMGRAGRLRFQETLAWEHQEQTYLAVVERCRRTSSSRGSD